MTPETKTPKKTESQIIDELLSNIPSAADIPVDLPSRGKFYSTGPITIRAMTFNDEKSMVSNTNVDIDVINTLLSRCVSNINIDELLLVDKLFLIMKLREISYGDDYKAVITCPACRKNNDIVFKLSELNIKYMPEDYENPTCVHFPIMDKPGKIELPRVRDERYLSNVSVTTTNFWRYLVDLDGHTKKTILSKVIEKLPLKDAHVILNVLGGDGFGVDTKVQFICNHCSNTEIIELPITADFFSGN
jgi:hypothetical protein